MSDEKPYPDVFYNLWNLGHILTSIMQISRSHDVPILVESFKAGSDLFDVLGAYNYGIYRKKGLHNSLTTFIAEIHEKHAPEYDSIISFAIEFSKDLRLFLKENNIE